jgi:hypothetical protein
MRVAAMMTAVALVTGATVTGFGTTQAGWSAFAGEPAVAMPMLTAAVNRCRAGVLQTEFGGHAELCPRPLALTQIDHKPRRSFHT